MQIALTSLASYNLLGYQEIKLIEQPDVCTYVVAGMKMMKEKRKKEIVFLYIAVRIYPFVRNRSNIQCVYLDSPSIISLYPEIKATDIRFSALKRYLSSFYFRIDNETGRIQ